MSKSCSHGYIFGLCPHGCHDVVELPPEPNAPVEEMELLPEPVPPITFSKLKCVICGEVVESGKVYKGKPICDPCMDGMKAGPIEPKVPRVTEEIKEKFPMQGKESPKKGSMQEVEK